MSVDLLDLKMKVLTLGFKYQDQDVGKALSSVESQDRYCSQPSQAHRGMSLGITQLHTACPMAGLGSEVDWARAGWMGEWPGVCWLLSNL